MVLAFMAQHIWEVGASVFAVLLIGQGLFWLIRGSSAAPTQGMGERVVRAIGGLAVIIGAGVVIAAFTVDAEQPGVHGGDGWGGTGGIVILGVWVALMCAGPVSKLIRATSIDRDGKQSE
jgi:hypothetical protein